MAFYLWNLKCIHKKEVNKRLQVASHTLKLDASGIGIKNIPENVFLLTQLKAVWLHENQIFKVPAEIGDLKEVTQIRLFSNNLKFLPAEIGQLRTLQVLWLQKNDLLCLPRELGLCTNLTILNVAQNSRLTQLPIELNTLKDLKQFTLDAPVFHFPPSDIASRSPTMIMSYLKRYAEARKTNILDLHASNATTIPYMMHELLPSLTAIHAISCRIPVLPPQLGLCTNITDLKFDRSVLLSPPQGIVNRGTKDILKFLHGLHAAQTSNVWYFLLISDFAFSIQHDDGANSFARLIDNVGLDGVPSEISVLTALTALDISENRVKVLPGSLIACSQLIKLRASKNEIDQLDDMSLYQSLLSIDISHNSIKSLPTSLFSLPVIQNIDAGFNKLKGVPKQISCCSTMAHLILCKNTLTSLPDTWHQCVNLVHLDIADNKIKRLPYSLGFAPLLKQFLYNNNPLESPPLEVLQAGSSEVTLRYLYRMQTALQTLSLDASGFGFVSVHSDIFILSQLLELNLANNELAHLPSEISLMTELKLLILSSNAFNVVPPVLTTLEDLTELDLSGNFLVKLPAQLGFLRKLRTLNVEGNPLKEPPLEVARRGMQAIIKFLKALGALPLTSAAVLTHQCLRKFPVAVLELGERCTEIDFSSNNLNALPSKFGNMLPALKALNFSYNQITQLPQSIECLSKLQVLNMTANALLAIPDVIARCTCLRRLLLSNNAPLQEIPSTIGNLTALVEIQANNCSLLSLPIQIGRLGLLETLGFSYNLVDVLPPTLVRCEALTDISFASNKIQTLPPWLGDLPLLQKCRFENNPLVFPSEMIQPRGHEFVMKYLLLFKAARLTKVLELIRMNFTQVPSEISPHFVGGFSLVALRLDFNPIKLIPDAIYRLHTLAELSISNTKLKAISEDVLLLTNLTLLQLHSNHLRYISPKLGFMTHLQRLSLSGNRKLLSPPPILWPYPTPLLLDYFCRNMAAAETCVLDWNNLKLGDISIMPKEVASFSSLVSLSLDNFGLSEFNLDVFSQMMSLENLSLAHNFIQSFGVVVMSTLTSLTFLDLQYNRVKLLPWYFFNMTRLIILNISNNPIESPPEPVCFAATLEVKRFCREMWDAQSHSRTILPDGTTSQQPAALRLTNFELREFCREIWEVPHLTHLDVSRNCISVVPDAITKLQELTTVNISNNRVSLLESWLPIKLPSLCDFDFSGNFVSLLVPLWAHATSLTRLNHAGNPITVPCAEILKRTCYELRLFFAHMLCVCEGLPLYACYAEHAYPEDSVGIKRVPVETVDSARPWHGILSLPHFGLTAYFPEWNDFTVLYSLSLHDNHLSDWPPRLEVIGAKTLFAIDLRCNKISNISSSICQLEALRYLYAQSNCIASAPDELWSLPCIDSIFLMDNYISSLSPSAAHCSSLRTLDISGNKISVIPRDFGLASHLPSFIWERNPLEEPPSCVTDRGWDFTRNLFKSVIDALETLALSLPNFGLDQLVSDTQDLSQITELNLSHNVFPAIPTAVFDWIQLTKVNVSNNAIKELPAAIINLNKLLDLNVSHNTISVIPANITSIVTLSCFRASNNVIEIIPAGLGQMPELRTLDLNSNKVSFAPSDLCRSTSITFLGLDSNPMRSPPVSIVQQGLRAVFFFLKCVDTAGSSGILDLRGLKMETLDYEVVSSFPFLV
jgi:Leucine-rich repeat (LRR) protein